MDTTERCLDSIRRHVEGTVGGPLALADGVLRMPSLAIELRVVEAKADGSGASRSVSAVIDARALDDDSDGIQVLCVGLGETADAAAVDAGHQWSKGVFPPLAAYLLGTPRPEVETMPLVVGVEGTGERFGWLAHLGPVLPRVYGPPGSDETVPGDLAAAAAFEPVFQVLHAYAAHTSLLWLESFAVRRPVGEVDATCRLDNHEIPEGREALLAWAAGWPDTGGCIVSRRQFVVLQPKAVDELPSRSDLVSELDREMRKRRPPWWKRLTGRA